MDYPYADTLVCPCSLEHFSDAYGCFINADKTSSGLPEVIFGPAVVTCVT